MNVIKKKKKKKKEGINTFDIGIYLKPHFHKNVHTFKLLPQIFPLLQEINLRAL